MANQKIREVFYSMFWVNEDGTLTTSKEDFASEAAAHEYADRDADDDRDYVVLPVHVRREVQIETVVRATRPQREKEDNGGKTESKKGGKPVKTDL